MKLNITREEQIFLATLGRQAEKKKAEYESALRDFRIAFESSMRARAIVDATFVSLSDDTLEVTAPDVLPQGPALTPVPDDAA
jgi:hypothetical protein